MAWRAQLLNGGTVTTYAWRVKDLLLRQSIAMERTSPFLSRHSLPSEDLRTTCRAGTMPNLYIA